MIWVGISAAALSFAISALATPVTRKVAGWFHMQDVPSPRRAHAAPTPLLGGCAILIAVLAPAAAALAVACVWTSTSMPAWVPLDLAKYVPRAAVRAPGTLMILAGAVALHVLGLVDDARPLRAWLKFPILTAVAASIVVLCHVRILPILGEPWSLIVTALWLVVTATAFNLMANVDGLSAGVALICAAGLLGISAGTGATFVPAALCLLIGALAGFLPYNFPPARSFMGSAGSLPVGFLLGVLSSLTTYAQASKTYYLYGVFVPLVLMAVPLYDMIAVVALRVRERHNPLVDGNRHFSHRLVKRGMSVRRSLLTVYLCAVGTAVAACLLGHVASNAGAILVFAQTITILLVVVLLETGAERP